MSTENRVVRDWLKALGVLVIVSMPKEEAAEKVRAFAALLGAEFPAAAFTSASLAAVARDLQWFTYPEITQRLSAWWRDNRPAPIALPAPKQTREDECEQFRREWGDPDAVRRSLRLCAGEERFVRMLATMVARWAPQNLPLVPPQFWPEWAGHEIEGEAA